MYSRSDSTFFACCLYDGVISVGLYKPCYCFYGAVLMHWPGEGPKGQISFNLNHSQFQRFLSQTSCVFSQLKDIKHIREISFRRLGHAPGYRGGLGGPKTFFPKFNQIWCASYLHEWHMQRHKFLGPRLLGPLGGAKRSNIIKSQLQSQFQRFLI